MTIRTILVDDEPLAIQGLELRLQAHDDVEIIAKCQNGREAISAIKTNKPDLVFLDIQMPGFDGFSVVQGLMDVEPPLFVFVTAYSDHALRAFEAQAVDYLMKPVEEGRLAETLDRVRQRLAERSSVEEAAKLKEALEEHAPEAAAEIADGGTGDVNASRFEKMLNIKDRGQIFRVDVDTIEMIEAVGAVYLSTYFEKCRSLLKPNGLALIQAITIEDARYAKALKTVDYIKRYIFPGSFIPCISVMTQTASNHQLRLKQLDDIGQSYAKTIHIWRERFLEAKAQVLAMGFDERFIRMWDFYLCYCEGGFEEGVISDVHLLFEASAY